jgi:ubiquitin C-terminal hydrolase
MHICIMLQTLDTSKLSLPFGLRNTGNLCYFNSLLQALVSCTSFNNLISNCVTISGHALFQSYAALCNGSENVRDTALFNQLHAARLSNQHNLKIGHQEDAHEGLSLLLDSLEVVHPCGHNLSRLFYVRHRCEIICTICKTHHKVRTEAQEPTELVIDLSEENPLTRKRLDTRKNIESYIKCFIQTPQDYKCDKCHAKNTAQSQPVIQQYTLTRLSEIIVILFKKYERKTDRYFPPQMQFMSSNGVLTYNIVAQIEHFGTKEGGHYVCRGLRRKPSELHQQRQERGAQRITQENDLQKIAEYQRNLAIDRAAAEQSTGVYLMNDTSFTYCPNGFEPTPATYMVFYHLVKN